MAPERLFEEDNALTSPPISPSISHLHRHHQHHGHCRPTAAAGGATFVGGTIPTTTTSIISHQHSLSTSSSQISFKDLKDAWEIKSLKSTATTSSTNNNQVGGNTTPKRNNNSSSFHLHNHPATMMTISNSSTTKSVPVVVESVDGNNVVVMTKPLPSKPPKRRYPNNQLYGRNDDTPSFDTTASSTASSGFPKSSSKGGERRSHNNNRQQYRGSNSNKKKGRGSESGSTRRQRGDLAREFDRVFDQTQMDMVASRANKGVANGGNGTVNNSSNDNNNKPNKGNNINSIKGMDETCPLLQELHFLMMNDDDSSTTVLSQQHTATERQSPHPNHRQQVVEHLSTVAEMMTATTSTPQPQIILDYGNSNNTTIPPSQEKTNNSPTLTPLAPHLLDAQQSPTPQDDDPDNTAAASENNGKTTEPPPKELSAFLTSPTGLHWEDLVRSMKQANNNNAKKDGMEYWLNKVIFVSEDDTVSELGSVVGGKGGHSGGGGDDDGGRNSRGFVGDLEMMGDVVIDHHHRQNPPPRNLTLIDDKDDDDDDVSELGSCVDIGNENGCVQKKKQQHNLNRMEDAVGDAVVVLGHQEQHGSRKEQIRHGKRDSDVSSISSKSPFKGWVKHKENNGVHAANSRCRTREEHLILSTTAKGEFQPQQKRQNSPLPKRKTTSPPKFKSYPRDKSPLRGIGKSQKLTTPLRSRARPRESLEEKVERVLRSGKSSEERGKATRRRALPHPPSRPAKSSPSSSSKPKPLSRIGSSSSSAFSPIKQSSIIKSPNSFIIRSPNTPATSAMETTFDSSFDRSPRRSMTEAITASPAVVIPNMQMRSSSETTFVSIERPEQLPQHQLFSSSVVTPQPISPRVSRRRRVDMGDEPRQQRRGRSSSGFGWNAMDGSKDVDVSPRLGSAPRSACSSVAARRRARRLYGRDVPSSSPSCDDPPVVMNISADEVTDHSPPPTPPSHQMAALQEEDEVEVQSLYEALDTLAKHPADSDLDSTTAAISTATNYFRQNKILPSGGRQEMEWGESAEDDPPLLPLTSATGDDSDEEDNYEGGNNSADANTHGNKCDERVVQKDDSFYYQIRGVNPLFDAEDDDYAAVAVSNMADVDNNIKKNNSDGNGDDEDALPHGFDAAAAAAAAKQRVELADKPNPCVSGRFKNTASIRTVSTTSASPNCNNITAALCSGLRNTATGGGKTDDRGRNNHALQQGASTVCILPESLHRKAPTCWQIFGHRLRKTKGEF